MIGMVTIMVTKLGMNKDFDNHLDAKRLFNQIDAMKYVNKEDMLKLGLQYF